MSDTNGVLHVGIDLGTSHSAISASNRASDVLEGNCEFRLRGRGGHEQIAIRRMRGQS